jgi:hypothetical protein
MKRDGGPATHGDQLSEQMIDVASLAFVSFGYAAKRQRIKRSAPLGVRPLVRLGSIIRKREDGHRGAHRSAWQSYIRNLLQWC